MRTRKRLLSLLLCGAMLFSVCSPSAYAEAQTTQDSGQAATAAGGLCEHHTEHTLDCGYTEGEPEKPCNHQHNEDCYPVETADSVSGNNAPPSNAEERKPENCDHVCDEESRCVTKKLDSQHEHDSECGYSSATEGKPCGYICEICNPAYNEEPETECVCEILCAEENINTDCPMCGAESADLTQCAGKETDEQVKAVQELIDALPTAEELSSMSEDEQKEEITGAEIFDSLFAFFNGMVNLLEAKENYNIEKEAVILTDTCASPCPGHTIIGTFTARSANRPINNIMVESGTHNIILHNVQIDVSVKTGVAAFSIADEAEVNLTLIGENILKSGNNCAGLQVPENAKLSIEEESNGNGGKLEAVGGTGGAGIGGGTVTATGQEAGIGNTGIGNKGNYEITFQAEGNAFIVASNISDQSGKSKNEWKGVIFENKTGKVYGDSVTLATDAEIPSGNVLTLNTGKKLFVPESVKLTNKGKLIVYGILEGTVTDVEDGERISFHTVNVEAEEGGFAKTIPGEYGENGKYPAGATVSLTAEPNIDYYFKEWEVEPTPL